ncbi:MFS transporter [Candidatus Woesearchaeota archaeon]|nr:MFS transporter [Candidatus Woesearchaeota archaeon]
MGKRLQLWSWCTYDLANTAFSALFVSFFFPLYIKAYLGGNEFHIGLVFGISMLLVAVGVPIIGAMSDRMKRRMPFIVFFTFFCCLFTWLIMYMNLFWALIFGLLANLFYHASLGVYNALLPEVASPKERGKISGYGVAAGYLGTLLSLVAVYFLFSYYGWESVEGIKATFPLTALLFFIPALFTFFFAEQKKKTRETPFFQTVKKSIADTLFTCKHVSQYKNFVLFLIAVFMFVNAISAVIVFLYLYGNTQIGLTIKDFTWVYGYFSLASLLGALVIGKISDKIGYKRTLVLSGYLWIPVILLLLFVQSYEMFLLAGILGGLALGIFWTAQRPLLIQLVPQKEIGQFFGFLEFTDKVSGIFGPIIFGYLALQNYQLAMFSLLGFFLVGLFLLSFVKVDHDAV